MIIEKCLHLFGFELTHLSPDNREGLANFSAKYPRAQPEGLVWLLLESLKFRPRNFTEGVVNLDTAPLLVPFLFSLFNSQ